MLRSMVRSLIATSTLKFARNSVSRPFSQQFGPIPDQYSRLGGGRLLNSARHISSGTDKEGSDLDKHVCWEEAGMKKYKTGIPASMIDIILTDINEEGLKKVEDRMGVKHLGTTSYPPTPFPVAGIIFGANKRLMICLACGYEDRPPIKIIFVVDTGSLHTFIIPSAIDAVLGPKLQSTRTCLELKLQSPDRIVEVYVSPQDSHFPDANVLGMAALAQLNLSVEIDYKQNAFHLVPNIGGSDFKQFKAQGGGAEKAGEVPSKRRQFHRGTFYAIFLTSTICTAGLLYLAKGRRDEAEEKSS